MEFKHFSHDYHSLIFNEEQKEVQVHGKPITCYGCMQSISGPNYKCTLCTPFFLHKSCAELPQELKHPMHPRHPLTLFAAPPYETGACTCDACSRTRETFTYHCTTCEFDLDIMCASLPPSIEHGGHEHPLTLQLKPALFDCDVCGITHEKGTSYQCTTCHFWVHQDCVSVPSTVEHAAHDHPLTLTGFHHLEYSKFRSYCDICTEELKPKNCVYYCGKCIFYAHVGCAIKTENEATDPTQYEDDNGQMQNGGRIQLPAADELVGSMTHIFNQISLGQSENGTKIKHFSHEHPLTLFNAQKGDEPSSANSVPLLKDDEKCYGCAQLISASFPHYRCSECKFVLHKWCAELPNEIRRPSHPDHPLILLAKATEEPFGLFQCNGCNKYCNGFTYHCAHCQFYLDVNCSSLVHSIKHQAHKHHLTLQENSVNVLCRACAQGIVELPLSCGTCKFYLHMECASFPLTFRHRYDKHPLILTLSPVKTNTEEFYCEICEEELNPKLWFYHCEECDYSFHTRCLRKVNKYSNVMFGGTHDIVNHPHPLTLIQKTANAKVDNPPCDSCSRPCDGLVFECRECSFNLDLQCACLFWSPVS